MLTAEQLAEIAARAGKATPGAWRLGTYNVWADEQCPPRLICDTDTMLHRRQAFVKDEDDANADFISRARSDIPALLAHIAELEADARLGKLLRQMPHDYSLWRYGETKWCMNEDWNIRSTPEEALEDGIRGEP